jgi:hypothetical protein
MDNRVLEHQDVHPRDPALEPRPGEPLTTAELFRGTGTTGEPVSPKQDVRHEALFAGDDAENFRRQWQDIQGSFVDEPRRSVEQADQLVASVIKRLADVFANERAGLERSWTSGQDVSTEDLRQALRRYRSFFDRLLSV